MAELTVSVKRFLPTFSHVFARRIWRPAVCGSVIRRFSSHPAAPACFDMVVRDQGADRDERPPGSGDVEVSPRPKFGDTLHLSTFDNRLFL